MGIETCNNCERTIGKLEQAHVYKGDVICSECNSRLRNNSTEEKPVKKTVKPPAIKPNVIISAKATKKQVSDIADNAPEHRNKRRRPGWGSIVKWIFGIGTCIIVTVSAAGIYQGVPDDYKGLFWSAIAVIIVCLLVRAADIKKNTIICPNPNCGYTGRAKKTARGNSLVGLVLLCLFVVPGLLYFMFKGGNRYTCPQCGIQIRNDN